MVLLLPAGPGFQRGESWLSSRACGRCAPHVMMRRCCWRSGQPAFKCTPQPGSLPPLFPPAHPGVRLAGQRAGLRSGGRHSHCCGSAHEGSLRSKACGAMQPGLPLAHVQGCMLPRWAGATAGAAESERSAVSSFLAFSFPARPAACLCALLHAAAMGRWLPSGRSERYSVKMVSQSQYVFLDRFKSWQFGIRCRTQLGPGGSRCSSH